MKIEYTNEKDQVACDEVITIKILEIKGKGIEEIALIMGKSLYLVSSVLSTVKKGE